jgi:hypothetical protein
MNESRTRIPLGSIETDARQCRLELARQAFKDFYAQCFWSYRPDAEITEDDIPWVVRELRHNGGHRGYRVAGELCR